MEAKFIKIETPKHLVLNGFIFGPKKNKIIFIFLHGLSGSLFSRITLMEKMTSSGATVMTFNNRGHGLINQFRKINPHKPEEYNSVAIGKAHEVFEECVDDIDGAINLARKEGYKKIVLVGHSTGCNKISYYLSKKSPDDIIGGILLAPMSDYADFIKFTDGKIAKTITEEAKKLVVAGKHHELLSDQIYPYYADAQRFLSLYTPNSNEEIFSYAVPAKKPTILLKIKKPLLVVLAGNDQFSDRPMTEIFNWFKETLNNKIAQVIMIKKSLHGFAGYETKLKNEIFNWTKNLK